MRVLHLPLAIILFVCFVFIGNAQTGCGTDALRKQLQDDPSYARKEKQYRDATRKQAASIAQGGANLRVVGGVSYIPVVVHVVAPTGTDANTFVTDQQVLDGINHLNQAFSNSGAYQIAGGVNTNIQFCLAKQDGMGQYTTGITRLNHNKSDLIYAPGLTQSEKDIKNAVIAANSSGGVYKYDPHLYLNIYLVRDISTDVAAYAWLPVTHGDTYQDGIVSEARYFGVSAEASKVMIHEAGHYLGLLHTFEGNCPSGNCPTDAFNTCPVNNQCDVDGDGICDTPPDKSTTSYPCNSNINTCDTDDDDLNIRNPFRPVSNGGIGNQPDMISNHMDYGDLACHVAFTQGQSNWMNATLTGARSSLMSELAIGCVSPCPNPLTVQFTASPNPVTLPATVSFTNTTTGNRTGYSWSWDFGDGTTSTLQTPAAKQYTKDGTFTVKLIATNNDVSCKREYQTTVAAICPLTPAFTVNGESQSIARITVGGSVTLVNKSTGATLIEWIQDGVVIGTGATLTKTFPASGGFMISQRISTSYCSKTSANVFIDVSSCGGTSGKERNNWVFGNANNTGDGKGNTLTFDNTGGLSVSSTSTLFNGFEGVSSISDAQGKLLLYASITKIYNREGGIISAVAGSTPTQILIAQHPNKLNSNLYYVFVPNGVSGTFSYLLIDMGQGALGLDGKPLGNKVGVQTPLYTGIGESLTGLKTADGQKIYIINYDYQTKEIVVYTIDQNGLNTTTPYRKSISSNMTQSYDCAKVSPDGLKLAISDAFSGVVEIYAFDPINGTVGSLLFSDQQAPGARYLEFSPDASKLYLTGTNTANGMQQLLCQYDLNNNYSEYNLTLPFGIVMYSIQAGLDGKIYGTGENNYLHTINSPNAPGSLCDFQLGSIVLTHDNASTSLPNFLIDLSQNQFQNKISGLSCIPTNTNNVQFSSSIALKANETLKWTVTHTDPMLAEIVSTSGNTATLNFYGAGVVKLKMELFSPCGYQVDEKVIQVGNAASLNLGPDQSNCNGSAVILDAGPGYKNYLWNTGSTDQVLITNVTGTYWVKVTDNCGSVATDYITISNGAATATIKTLNNEPAVIVPTCHPSVTLISSTLQTYTWKKDGTIISGATNSTLIVNAGGIYTVEGVDARNCFASASIKVIDELTITGDDAICPGDKASLQVNIAGVQGNYYVQWIQNGGTPTYTPSGGGGEYSALVVLPTFSACTLTTASKHVALKPAPSPYIVSIDKHFICSGDPGAIITANAPAYTAVPITGNTWSNGVTFSGMPAINTLTNVTVSGSYNVVSMGDNGCTAVSNWVILLSPDISITQRCTSGGAGTELIADQNISGGSFIWKNSAGTVVATTQSYVPSIVGTYTVTSTSTNCLATTSTVVCTPPSGNLGTNLVTRGDFNIAGVASPICTNYAVSSDLTCSDATTTPLNAGNWPSNFKITSNAGPENLNKWSGTGYTDPTKPNDIYCLIADGRVTSNDERVWYQQIAVENCATYTFRALIDNIIINEAEIPKVSLRIKTANANIFIKGTTVFANQSNWVELSGTWKSTLTGTVEVSVVLDGGGFVGRDIAVDEIYFAKTNCLTLNETRVGRSCNAVTSVGMNKYICSGQSVQIGNNAGTIPGLTYSWTAPDYSSTTMNPTVNPTTTNTYKLIVTDNVNNCSATDYVTVTIIAPEVTITKDLTAGCTASQVKASLFNGVPNVQYEWQVNSSPVTTNATGVFSLTGIANGATVRCRLVTACASNIYSNEITVGTSAPVTATQTTICSGQSTQLHANMSGGTAPFTYTWTASTGAAPSAVAEPIVSPTTPTTYSLTFKDANNCTFTGSVTVVVNALPPAVSVSPTTACVGTQVWVTASQGAGNQLISLTDPSFMNRTNGTGGNGYVSYLENITAAGTGNFVAVSRSTMGCERTTVVPFTAYAAPVPMTVAISKNPACIGDQINVSVNYGVGNTLTNFTDPSTISRIGGGGGPGTISFSANVISAGAGNFVGVATNAQGCTTTTTVPFTVVSPPAMTIVPSSNPVCVGSTFTVTVNYGTGSGYSVTSQTDPSIISRLGGTGFQGGYAFGATAVTAGIGNFVGVVTSTEGCTTTTTVPFTVAALPTAQTVSITPNPACEGGAVTVGVTYSTGNTGTLTKPSMVGTSTNGGGGQYGYGYTAPVTAAGTGNFVSTTTSPQGCSTVVNIPFTALPRPAVPAITSTGTLICSGSPILLSTTATATGYQWYNGATLITGATNTSYSATAAGTYTMRVSDANACWNTSAGIALTTSTLAAPRVHVDDATDNYCASAPVAMKVGTALQLNGTTQYVNVPGFNFPASGSTYGGPITIEFWVNTTGTYGSGFSIGGLNTTGNRAQAHVPGSDGSLYWDYGNYSGNGRISAPFANFIGRWTHVAFVSAGNGGNFKGIYINGVLASSSTVSDGPDVQLNGLTIGKWMTYYTGGMMDEFRVWNKVLSAAEVQAAMTTLYESGTPNLMGSWGFDEASGTTVNNDAFSAQTGTLMNSAARVYPTTGLTYTWSPAANLNTSTGTTVIPNTSVVRTYTVQGVDANGCSAYAQVVATPNTACKDGADEALTGAVTDWDVNVYPNPTEGNVHISFKNITSDTDLSLEVVGMDGAVIFTIDHVGMEEVVNLHELPSGLYLIRVKNGEEVKTKKVVVVK